MAEDTFISHLVELRDRLLRAIIAVGIVFVCLFPFASELYDWLARPLLSTLPQGSTMIATGVVTPFLIPVKVAAMVAFSIALPYVLFQGWAFVAPGLYAHEKRLVLPLVFASTVLFFIGVAFCYFFVFRLVFDFVFNVAPKSITVAPDIENYLNFVLTLFLAFGLTFEVPIVVLVLTRMGIVTIEQLVNARPYFIVGAFVVAAIVTPPDVISQLLLAFPMWILFEVGILAARAFSRPPARDESIERELDSAQTPEKGPNS